MTNLEFLRYTGPPLLVKSRPLLVVRVWVLRGHRGPVSPGSVGPVDPGVGEGPRWAPWGPVRSVSGTGPTTPQSGRVTGRDKGGGGTVRRQVEVVPG